MTFTTISRQCAYNWGYLYFVIIGDAGIMNSRAKEFTTANLGKGGGRAVALELKLLVVHEHGDYCRKGETAYCKGLLRGKRSQSRHPAI